VAWAAATVAAWVAEVAWEAEVWAAEAGWAALVAGPRAPRSSSKASSDGRAPRRSILPDDKEVAFATAIGRMAVKTKFNFKEMMYHETLAI
jgi:hypothetical protein